MFNLFTYRSPMLLPLLNSLIRDFMFVINLCKFIARDVFCSFACHLHCITGQIKVKNNFKRETETEQKWKKVKDTLFSIYSLLLILIQVLLYSHLNRFIRKCQETKSFLFLLLWICRNPISVSVNETNSSFIVTFPLLFAFISSGCIKIYLKSSSTKWKSVGFSFLSHFYSNKETHLLCSIHKLYQNYK